MTGSTVSGVARPFRFQPPTPPDGTVTRRRLLELMARRWDRRLVTVVAGPGFGKSVLLAETLNDQAGRDGRDVWLTCEPADESADHLAGGLCEALGLARAGGLENIVDEIWSAAPTMVCLVLDDVHEISPCSSGAQLLGRLLTELPTNGHVVMASRDPVPVATARLAASRQVERISEQALAFDAAELAQFARRRGVEAALLDSTSGWPALAELTATAGSDLVLDYLWEEVLRRLDGDVVSVLARLSIVGGGDDEMASALAGRAVRVADLVASVPLVSRSGDWVTLHALWQPAMARMVSAAAASEARRTAAAVHQKRRRFNEAIELLAEAQSWDGVVAVMREVLLQPFITHLPSDIARWKRTLPVVRRDDPVVLLATALELEASAQPDAAAAFELAAHRFRERDDSDGELAAIAHEGLLRWWASDIPGLIGLYERVQVLAASSSSARALNAVCLAGIAHLGGDSADVHRHLAGFHAEDLGTWFPTVQWLKSVAYRRDGDVPRARQALAADEPQHMLVDPQGEIAKLRCDWLDGDVTAVRARLATIADDYERDGALLLARETMLELATKTAWLGEVGTTRALLARADSIVVDVVPVLQTTLRVLADAALAVAEGDEHQAASRLSEPVREALSGPTAWYWRDRTAIALTYVLVPETRALWETQPLGPAHLPGLALGRALEASRRGELGPIRSLHWPRAGVVRAHLPTRWVAELVAAASAARVEPPPDLLAALGDEAHAALHAVSVTSRHRSTASAARRLASTVPSPSLASIAVAVVGPLEIRRDGEAVDHPDLRRQRVRELLCYLVAHPNTRRETVIADLWPEHPNGAQNLRMTLSYVHRLLEPNRSPGEPPYFVRTDGLLLRLARVSGLTIDLWDLEDRLDQAETADQAGTPSVALTSYQAALALWRGEPLADAPYADWATPVRARVQARFTRAAHRTAQLLLAARDHPGARAAALTAIRADRHDELAYQLLISAQLGEGDLDAARQTLEWCAVSLRELDLSPQPATVALVTSVRTGAPSAPTLSERSVR